MVEAVDPERQALAGADGEASGSEYGGRDDIFTDASAESEKTAARLDEREERDVRVSRTAAFLRKAEPILLALLAVMEALEPVIIVICKALKWVWVKARPFHPEEFLPAAYGLVMVFFGGAYMLTLAAVEAFRIFGWEKLKVHLVVLYENAKVAYEAHKEDEQVDEDGDGVADVKQITSKRELFARKVKLVLRTIDPDSVSGAIAGLAQGWFAVLATLRLQFAQAITLGVTIGELGERVTGRLLRKVGYVLMPDEYDKWVPAIVSYSWRLFGIWFSLMIQRGISAFYSSMRGAELFLWGTLTYLVRRRVLSRTHVEPGTVAFTVLITLIGGFGFYWQLIHFFQLPFPLNILFFPLTLVEWFIQLSLVFVH
mmetsp:Transcript_7093/g.15153  ORF Transcript_7093/g.15153 Transcript_7093/m.15153 type:complete len:370 (+) Transcript_7093:42-1151(+)